jgi:hypothetical protein
VCRTACVSSADCCFCGAATICQSNVCMTPGEAHPECRTALECAAGRACTDALCGP